MAEVDDATLVAASIDEPECFAELFRRYVDEIRQFVWRRCRSAHLADEITAVTFEKAWRALPTFEPRHATVRPWLMRIAANELASHYRSQDRRRRREHLAAVRDPTAVPPVDDDTRWHDRRTLTAMSTLSERHQEVLMLRFVGGLDAETTAGAIGVTRPHLAVIQHRAISALRRAVQIEENRRTRR